MCVGVSLKIIKFTSASSVNFIFFRLSSIGAIAPFSRLVPIMISLVRAFDGVYPELVEGLRMTAQRHEVPCSRLRAQRPQSAKRDLISTCSDPPCTGLRKISLGEKMTFCRFFALDEKMLFKINFVQEAHLQK